MAVNNIEKDGKKLSLKEYVQAEELGLLPGAFENLMRQIEEWEAYWKQEMKEAHKQAEIAEGYNDLLLELTRKRHEWILVVDRENQDIMYCNKSLEAPRLDAEYCHYCEKRLSFRHDLLDWKDDEEGKVWEAVADTGNIYQITTFPIVWKNRKAYAHIVLDITIDKETSRKLKAKAYRDQGTGIYNRTYFMEYMNRLLEDSRKAVLCYMDLDGLKHVNDNYGHLEGDEYIRSFVETIQRQLRDMDVFARIGGDEFCAVLTDCPREMAYQKMLLGLDNFLENHKKEYPASFSFGIVEIEDNEKGMGIEELLHQADEAMYECKRHNKIKYHQKGTVV
ncbi:MAG: GGDEF domain-containing protein [Lachnospiraceae bacterium]|nr:GGDEF domain-containing protein [Lachnospiraceae bacterium]